MEEEKRGKMGYGIAAVSAAGFAQMRARGLPRGLFLFREGGIWIAVDNSTGEEWTEEFRHRRNAVRYLRSSAGIGEDFEGAGR